MTFCSIHERPLGRTYRLARKDDRNPAQDKAARREPGLSVVACGMSITGHLDTNGVVRVEGKVTGSVRAERQVLIAKGGMVDGDILTREAIIGGEVRGAIYADERVEVQATSLINGDIRTKRILLQEGGEVNGHVRMEDPKALSRKTERPGETESADGQPPQSDDPEQAEPQQEESKQGESKQVESKEEPETGGWRPVGHEVHNP